MNILVIGNGFDLAHGLPTYYNNFLEFCKRAKKIYTMRGDAPINVYEQNCLNDWKINDDIKNILYKNFNERTVNKILKVDNTFKTDVTTPNKALDELYSHINHNAWLEYFLRPHFYDGESWIDFELEISRVIQKLDNARFVLNDIDTIDNIEPKTKEIIDAICLAAKWDVNTTFGDIKSADNFTIFLNAELERLIRALEIYIAEFINGITVTNKSVDIEALKIDHVLSFNYSDTYAKVYGKGQKIEYDYIHGKADINKSVVSSNLVLGIDEYLDNDMKNKAVEFITFKKFYQRIYKGTGCEYREWVDEIRESGNAIEAKLRKEFPIQIPFNKYTNDARHKLYIFGHSLDVTDKDILRDLILNDNVYTTIYYFSKDKKDKRDLSAKIANLVKVIGQDELIRRTGGSTKTIEFKLQQDMVERV